MVFVNGNGPIPALDFAFPDVCKTPVLDIPVPIPYPNTSLGPTAIPSQMTFFTMMMPSHNLATIKPITMGDQPGVELGVVGPFDMGATRHIMGSTNFFIGGPPCTKMTSPTGQNGLAPNALGATITPAQIVLISLR
jgi:hypothetical protein